MFISKQKYLTIQSQLEQAGVDISQLQKRLNKYTYNTNVPMHANYNNYLLAFKDLDAQQCIGRYIWEGLPPYIQGWQIEAMLYYRSVLVGFYKGGQLYILPFAQDGEPNIYGYPTSVQPIAYNGVDPNNEATPFGLKLAVNVSGQYNKNAPAVLLFDRPPTFGQGAANMSRAVINRQLIELQADIMCRIENNLEAASLKLCFEYEDEKTAKVIDQDICDNLAAGKSWVLVRKGTMSDRDGKPYQTGITLETQELVELWQSVNSIRCGCSSIRNGGAFEKKERAINAELESDDVQTDITADMGRIMRELFITQLRLQYPEKADDLKKIKVRLNAPTRQAEEANDPVRERETVKDGEKEEVKYA